jgi:hypothetical protein
MDSHSVSPLSNADLKFHELAQLQGRNNNKSAKQPPSGKAIMSKLRRRKQKQKHVQLKSSATRLSTLPLDAPEEDEGDTENDVSPWELVNLALEGQSALDLAIGSSDEGDVEDEDRVLTDSYSKKAALQASSSLSFVDDLRRKSASLVRALSDERDCAAQLVALQARGRWCICMLC